MNIKKIETPTHSPSHSECKHQSLTREWVFGKTFMLGMPTENYVCTYCGLSLSSILRGARENKSGNENSKV